MAGPLPHPGGLEFALPSNSAGFGAKHIPKLPLLLLLSRLCLGLTCWRGAKLAVSHSASWPITPATCPWVLPGAEQGLGGGVGGAVGWLSVLCLPAQDLPGVPAGEHL